MVSATVSAAKTESRIGDKVVTERECFNVLHACRCGDSFEVVYSPIHSLESRRVSKKESSVCESSACWKTMSTCSIFSTIASFLLILLLGSPSDFPDDG